MNMTTSTRAVIPSLQTVKIVLFLLVWVSCAWFGSWEMNTNNAVRVYTAISLVEDGDATIDEFDSATIDKSRVGDHLYLDKAPGMSLMALPAVAALHLLSPQRSKTLTKTFFDPDFSSFIRARTRLAVATGPAILTALATVLLFNLALTITGSVSGALAAALGYALATPAWGWSTTLLGHAPVAALYVIALWAGERATQDSRTRRWAALLVGISLGFAVVIEYQAVLAGVAIALWVVWRTWRRADRTRLLALAAAGGALGLMPLAGYNLIAYGSVLRLGYQGVVSFPGFDHGIFGIGLPDLKALWNIVASRQRGLLFYAPILVFAVGGLFLMCRDRATRDIGIVATAVVAITLFLHAGYFYWEGGNATGPRRLCARHRAGLAVAGPERPVPVRGHALHVDRDQRLYRCDRNLCRFDTGLSAARCCARSIPLRQFAYLGKRVSRLVARRGLHPVGKFGAASPLLAGPPRNNILVRPQRMRARAARWKVQAA
jgi:4-amino-4-deoxy-L-arabinose transferase-like glycosyltransferase